jgi:hypothetical protein
MDLAEQHVFFGNKKKYSSKLSLNSLKMRERMKANWSVNELEDEVEVACGRVTVVDVEPPIGSMAETAEENFKGKPGPADFLLRRLIEKARERQEKDCES